jgi:hypothetical protein
MSHIRRTTTKLSCFQKMAVYGGIRIFNILPRSPTSLKNEQGKFNVALR